MNCEGPRKDLNVPSAAGFRESLEPSLQFPGTNRKSGNSEVDIRKKSRWTSKYKRIKPQNESSAGFGLSYASRWLFVLEICQVWICDEGMSSRRWSTEKPRSHPDGARGDGATILIFLPLLSSIHVDALLGLPQEIGFIEACLEDKGGNEC